MEPFTSADAAHELARAKASGLYPLLVTAAKANGLSVAYVLAIASRETNIENVLGDFRGGEYHGIGVLQADIQHDIARQARDNGTWKTHPQALIDFCCAMLAANVQEAAKDYPKFTLEQHLKIAADAYNGGDGTADAGVKLGNADHYTTGGDYGEDVLRRMALFAPLVGE